MPIHPHECVPCGHHFEVVTLRVSTVPDPACPKCGKAAERRFGVPHLDTDTNFFAGAKLGGGQFQPYTREAYTLPAKMQGVSINGAHYQHGLARYPGDPRAFVRDRGEMKKLLEERGWGSEDLGVKARNDYEPKRVPIDERLVSEELDTRVKLGEIDPGDKEKARDQVRDDITPHWHKK